MSKSNGLSHLTIERRRSAVQTLAYPPAEEATGYHKPGPGRDLMHAIHVSHDAKRRSLKRSEARKTKESG